LAGVWYFPSFFHPLKTLEKTGDLIRAEND